MQQVYVPWAGEEGRGEWWRPYHSCCFTIPLDVVPFQLRGVKASQRRYRYGASLLVKVCKSER